MICSKIVSIIGDVRVSWVVRILHSSRKVTIYSFMVSFFFRDEPAGKWTYRIPGLRIGKNRRDPGQGEKEREDGLQIGSIMSYAKISGRAPVQFVK